MNHVADRLFDAAAKAVELPDFLAERSGAGEMYFAQVAANLAAIAAALVSNKPAERRAARRLVNQLIVGGVK